jgi:predicted acyl esterase
MTPFVEETLEFPSWECSHVFKAGNRMRLHVAGSSFPYYGRNPGECVPIAGLPPHGYSAVSQFVLHGPGQRSSVSLRVADLGKTKPWTPA